MRVLCPLRLALEAVLVLGNPLVLSLVLEASDLASSITCRERWGGISKCEWYKVLSVINTKQGTFRSNYLFVKVQPYLTVGKIGELKLSCGGR